MMRSDADFMKEAYAEAQKGLEEGGLPIGAVLVRGGEIIGRGHNQRVQKADPILHGEMACMQNAGRQASYRDTVMYTTLSPSAFSRYLKPSSPDFSNSVLTSYMRSS